jgi:hypothetical protein
MQMSGSGFFQFSNVGFIFFSLVFFSQFHSIKLNILSLKIGLNFIPLNLSIATRLTFFKSFFFIERTEISLFLQKNIFFKNCLLK